MKPKDLKPSFTWEERQVVFKDRILFVPAYYDHYDTFVMPSWNDALLFGNDNPVVIEYCSGNGHWIVEKAKQQQGCNFVAVEKRFDRVQKIWSKLKNASLNNLIVVCGEAQTFTEHYIAAGSIQDIYVNFPDPWPKERHAKHRLIQTPFVESCYKILKPQGVFSLATDDVPYSEQMIAVFKQHLGFASAYPDPYYTTDVSDYGASTFDALWREQGRPIRYLRFILFGKPGP